MARLIIEHLSKRFGEVRAVDDLSLTVGDGEFVTLLGPSGCGKSTTLFAIAGLDRPTAGRIQLDDAVFFDGSSGRFLEPEKRSCGLVFQSYALWPHMTVRGNLAFPLKLRRVPKARLQARVEEALALVEMESYMDRYPHELSGGQQQRVALARTLVYEPRLLLLDEPLSNLDAKLRVRARSWLKDLQARLGITTVYVTHDQMEALSLSDRIAVMNAGRIVQVGSPESIYRRPDNVFVADFIGSSNFLTGRLAARRGNGSLTVALGDGQQLVLDAPGIEFSGEQVIIAIRPENIRIHEADTGLVRERGNLLRGVIKQASYLGSRFQYLVEVAGSSLRVETDRECREKVITAELPRESCLLFFGD